MFALDGDITTLFNTFAMLYCHGVLLIGHCLVQQDAVISKGPDAVIDLLSL